MPSDSPRPYPKVYRPSNQRNAGLGKMEDEVGTVVGLIESVKYLGLLLSQNPNLSIFYQSLVLCWFVEVIDQKHPLQSPDLGLKNHTF